jgi:hypothetical protein
LIGVNSTEAFVYTLSDIDFKVRDYSTTVPLSRKAQDFAWEVYSNHAYPDLIEEQVDD